MYYVWKKYPYRRSIPVGGGCTLNAAKHVAEVRQEVKMRWKKTEDERWEEKYDRYYIVMGEPR